MEISRNKKVEHTEKTPSISPVDMTIPGLSFAAPAKDAQVGKPTKLIFLSMAVSFLQAPILGRQDTIQLLHQPQKFLPILLHRDFGAKLLNAVTL